MTITVYPIDAVAGAPLYSARVVREALSVFSAGATSADPFACRSGVRPGTSPLTVTATSTAWTIGAHAGILDVQPAIEASGYPYAINGVGGLPTGPMTAADGTRPRVDIVWLRVDDPGETDGSSVPAIVPGYTVGVPLLTNPVPPATPARCMLLAWVNVPASGGGAPTVTWKAPYTVAAGAPIPVNSQAERDALVGYLGLQVKRLDVGGCPIDWHNGAAWVSGDTGWITPTLLNGWVNFSGGYAQVAYRRFNGVTYITGIVKNGASVAGQAIFNLPGGFRPNGLIMRGTVGSPGSASFPLEVNGATGNLQQGAVGANPAWTVLDMSFPSDA